MAHTQPTISVVTPVLNEEENIPVLYQEVRKVCEEAGVGYEMIFVDDGSTDNSLAVIKGLRKADRKVRYLSLSRNFGHQNALFAGLTHAGGDAVITMDADLQHPPRLIAAMIERWQKGADVVYTVKQRATLSPMKHAIVRASYWFISKVSGLRLEFGQSDFRLIDKKILKLIVQIPEYHKFLRGQVSWLGFRQEGISYDVEKRRAGTPKYSYKSLYDLALNGIFSFGRYPLHLVMMLGLCIFFASTVYIFLLLVIWLLKIAGIVRIAMPPGWTTLSMAVFFLGSIQLIALGVLSEYVGRIYDQAKGRPVFIARETSEEGESRRA